MEKLPYEYQQFQDVFSEKAADILPPHRTFDCPIELLHGTMPPRGHIYNLTGPEKVAMKDYIEENLRKGFIRPSTSPAGAGFFFVQKKDGGLRPCIDYRGLNKITVKNRYPLPLIDDLFSQVAGAQIFSKLDLRGAYNLIRIRQGDEWKTAFNTQNGHYEYLVMPFGLCNAPAVFQDFVNEIFREVLGKFLVVYLDDILIFSKNLSEHRQHVIYVLKKLRENSLYAKPEKCLFEVTEVSFLGYIISRSGLSMDQKKVSAVLDWPLPLGLKPLQRFLGFANYYRRFIRSFSKVVAPLTDLTKKGADTLNWSSKAKKAFSDLKMAFCSAPILVHVDVLLPFYIEVDASDLGVGAVLSQYSGSPERLHPCAFFSKKFSAAERNYDVGNRELLAIKMAFEEWRHWLEGAEHNITVFTDHKNLVYIENAKRLNPRQARWALFFARFKFTITYKPGDKNCKADALSRCFEDEDSKLSTPASILSEKIVVAATELLQDLERTLLDAQADAPMNKPTDVLFVPLNLRLQVLQQYHCSKAAGHPGEARTLELISRQLWWPSMQNDCKTFIANCSVCARNKAPRSAPAGLLHPLPVPSVPWTHISMDFVGELPSSRGKTFVLVVVDRFSKMSHFIPLGKLPSAKELSDLFIENIFRLHGIPENIVSDRGVQFTARFWKAFCARLGITLSYSSGFHPQSNGQTERVNQTMEQFLRCFVSDCQEEWVDFLPFAEFAQNNLRNSSSRFSPFQIVYGRSPKFSSVSGTQAPFPAIEEWAANMQKNWSQVNSNLKKAIEAQKIQADKHRSVEIEFAPGDLVWVSTKNIALRQPSAKLGPRFIGPFPVAERINRVTYRVSLPASMKGVKSFHVSLLKPAANVDVSVPPPVLVDGEQEYEVEKILDARRFRNSLQFLVHWKGYGPEERSWVPARFVHAEELVKEFLEHNPGKSAVVCSESTPQGGDSVRNSDGMLHVPAAGSSSAVDAAGMASDIAARGPLRRSGVVAVCADQAETHAGDSSRRVRATRPGSYALRKKIT